MLTEYWAGLNPRDQLGVPATAEVSTGAKPQSIPGISRIQGPGLFDVSSAPPWSPHNALFWFGLLAGATFGFIAFSTSVRVGPAKAGVSVGKGA